MIRALEGQKYERSSPVFKKALEWIGYFPQQLDLSLKSKLVAAFCSAFGVSEADIAIALAGGLVQPEAEPKPPVESREAKLRKLLPKGGWFEWYDNFTNRIEGPLAYHIFSSFCALGASVGRRVYIPMGHFNIYLNYAAVLVGPPAIKKTTVADIAHKLIEKSALCPTLPDKATPERMISLLKETGHQFLYVPEMAVFFGKQRYNEGLTTQLLRMLDSPDKFMVSTQARGEEEILEPTITLLGCTTPSLLAKSTPDEVSSSGFLSRLLLISERFDERCFHRPEVGVGEAKLLATLARLKAYAGKVDFTKEADDWFADWYRKDKSALQVADETVAEVRSRGQAHLLRTASLIHLVQCDSLHLCVGCLQTADSLLNFVASGTPELINRLKQNTVSADADYVLESLVRMGGAGDHSNLLRKCASRMNSVQMKAHIRTLEESGRVKVSKKGIATYYLVMGVEE